MGVSRVVGSCFVWGNNIFGGCFVVDSIVGNYFVGFVWVFDRVGWVMVFYVVYHLCIGFGLGCGIWCCLKSCC